MSSRIRIFDHWMKPLAEFNGVPTTPRNWLLNKYGRAEFSISTSDRKCTLQNLQFGNLVHIEHIPSRTWTLAKNGKLPDWTGIILPDRTWDLGVVHVTAYSAEVILAFRAMQYKSVKDTPAAVFREILKQASSRARNIVIQPGVVDDSSVTFEDDLRTNAYDHILKLVGDCGMDWDVTGEIDENGGLKLYGNLYQSKGIRAGVTLNSSNTELSAPLLLEQGTPTNQVFGYSQASTSESRIGPLEGVNQGALDDYGALQLNQVYIGKRDPAGVLQSARNKAEGFGRPKQTVRRIALDKGDMFNWLNVGNTMTVKETRAGFSPDGGFGFESDVRIMSMDYNDLSNKVPLNIEVI